METKEMYIADLNMVFGKKNEPLLSHINDVVLPALQSNLFRETGKNNTIIFFDKVDIRKLDNGEFVLSGLLIKKTVLDVKSEYTQKGLVKTDKKVDSAPFSMFMIYLKNHRMLLIKNQNGSPDLRSFNSTIREIIKKFVKINNALQKENKTNNFLPFPTVNVTGIKTRESIKEALKNVKKINELIIKLYPLNSEWDFHSPFGSLDRQVRQKIQSKRGTLVYRSPQSKEGVAEFIEGTEGLVKTQLKVEYNEDISSSGSKRTGTIKDAEISSKMHIDINNGLDEAYNEVNKRVNDIAALHVETDNLNAEYQKYLENNKFWSE